MIARDLAAAVVVRAGARGDGDDRGDGGAGVGDERLGAVDDPLAARRARALVRVAPASQPASGSVRPKPASARPATRSGSQRCLLLLGAVGEDRVDAQADAGRQRDAERLVDPAELLDGDAQAGEVAARAPPNSSGTTRPNSPRSPIFGTRSTGKWCSRSHCGDVRRDLGLGEVAHHLAEVLVVLAQLEHRSAPCRGRRGSPRRLLDVDVNVKHDRRRANPVTDASATPASTPVRRPTGTHLVDRRGRRASSASPTARCGTTRTSA